MDPYLEYRERQDGLGEGEKAGALPLTWASVMGSKVELAKPSDGSKGEGRRASPRKVGRPPKEKGAVPRLEAEGVATGRDGSPRKVGRPRKVAEA